MRTPQKLAIFIAGWVPIMVLWFFIIRLASIFYFVGAVLSIAYIYYLSKAFDGK